MSTNLVLGFVVSTIIIVAGNKAISYPPNNPTRNPPMSIIPENRVVPLIEITTKKLEMASIVARDTYIFFRPQVFASLATAEDERKSFSFQTILLANVSA